MENTLQDRPDLSAILRLLAHAKVTVFAQDAQLRYRWIENPPETWDAADAAGKSDVDILPAKAAAIASALKQEVRDNGRAQWSELAVENHRGMRYFDLYVGPADDQTSGLVGIAIDITDRMAHAATMETVAREQAHRTKNLLAVIQSLGTQTARSSASTEDFIETFRGRIQSISRSQDLSIGPKRHGARLSELIASQVFPYIGDVERLAFGGEDRFLSATGALHVGLAFYELCIAATQSGSLSVPDGKVAVAATVDDRATARPRYLEVTWSEVGGPTAPPIDGFSQALLERIVPAAVGGKATISQTGTGRRYALTIADTEFE